MTAVRLLDDLMAPFVGSRALAAAPAANAAKVANRYAGRGFPAHVAPANALRIFANGNPDSQTFAGDSQEGNGPESEERRGFRRIRRFRRGWAGMMMRRWRWRWRSGAMPTSSGSRLRTMTAATGT